MRCSNPGRLEATLRGNLRAAEHEITSAREKGTAIKQQPRNGD